VNPEPNTSVSRDTMRPEDLIPAFIAAIPDDAERARFERRLDGLTFETGDQQEEMDALLDDLFDALDAHAPEGCYFGAHPGDGSDYGFWRIEIEEEEPAPVPPARALRRVTEPERSAPMIRVTLAVGTHDRTWYEEDVTLPYDPDSEFDNEAGVEDRAVREWERRHPGEMVAFLTVYATEGSDGDGDDD